MKIQNHNRIDLHGQHKNMKKHCETHDWLLASHMKMLFLLGPFPTRRVVCERSAMAMPFHTSFQNLDFFLGQEFGHRHQNMHHPWSTWLCTDPGGDQLRDCKDACRQELISAVIPNAFFQVIPFGVESNRKYFLLTSYDSVHATSYVSRNQPITVKHNYFLYFLVKHLFVLVGH